MFRTVPLSINRSFFFCCTRSSGICHTGLVTAVSKPVWYIQFLCVQWKTPDDGQRNCPKHVELYSKNKLEKLEHLVGFIKRIYHDARSPESQINVEVEPVSSFADTWWWRNGYVNSWMIETDCRPKFVLLCPSRDRCVKVVGCCSFSFLSLIHLHLFVFCAPLCLSLPLYVIFLSQSLQVRYIFVWNFWCVVWGILSCFLKIRIKTARFAPYDWEI